MPHVFTQPCMGFQRPLQLSQLLHAAEGTRSSESFGTRSSESFGSRSCESFGSRSSESLLTTLEVRITSLSREFSIQPPQTTGDVFERATSMVEQVSPLSLVQGIVLPLALDGKGCRLLQVVLEEADSASCKELVSELRGHVREALDSPHANHVLQRVIELVPPRSVQFILDELASSWDMSAVVQHRFGCRLLERMFEHFTACPSAASTLDFFLANGAFGDLKGHCYHMFGTHVMQHMMEYGSYEQQLLVCNALRSDLRKAALDEFAVGVLDKALTYLPLMDQQVLAQEILQQQGLLPRMAMCWRGQPAAERVIRIVEGAALSDALSQIGSHQQALRRSKGGRTLLTMANKRGQ